MHVKRPRRAASGALLIAIGALGAAGALRADPVAVRFPEGVTRGFLSLRSTAGKILADGELSQTAHGLQVTTRLVFHFRDGSIQDETVVFSQDGHFRLLSDHLVQKGPTFPMPMEVRIDGESGQVDVRYTEKGEEKVASEHLDLPADVANGLLFTLLKNVPEGTGGLTLSMVATAPKPRLVKLEVSRTAEDGFTVGAAKRKATRYLLKVDIGGVAGAVAPLVGKQPPDSHIWIEEGTAPGFLRAVAPLFPGGPLWDVRLASPAWPKGAPAEAAAKKEQGKGETKEAKRRDAGR